jgi:hypothetical protein
MHPPGGQGEYAARVPDGQGAGPVARRPAGHGLGGFVVGLADPAAVPALHHTLAPLGLPPAP